MRRTVLLGWVLFMVGCSTPVTRFHSLLPAASGTPATLQTAPTAVELLPIVLPAQVDRPQWVLWREDQTLQLLEHERWVAPVADELQGALALRLAQLPLPATTADGPWRVALELRRWEARLNRSSRLEAVWTVHAGSARVRQCTVALEQAAAAGTDGLATAHRALVARLAEAVAASLRAC